MDDANVEVMPYIEVGNDCMKMDHLYERHLDANVNVVVMVAHLQIVETNENLVIITRIITIKKDNEN